MKELNFKARIMWTRAMLAEGDAPMILLSESLGQAIMNECPRGKELQAVLDKFDYPLVQVRISTESFENATKLTVERGYIQAADEVGDGTLFPSPVFYVVNGKTVYGIPYLLAHTLDLLSQTATEYYVGIILP